MTHQTKTESEFEIELKLKSLTKDHLVSLGISDPRLTQLINKNPQAYLTLEELAVLLPVPLKLRDPLKYPLRPVLQERPIIKINEEDPQKKTLIYKKRRAIIHSEYNTIPEILQDMFEFALYPIRREDSVYWKVRKEYSPIKAQKYYELLRELFQEDFEIAMYEYYTPANDRTLPRASQNKPHRF